MPAEGSDAETWPRRLWRLRRGAPKLDPYQEAGAWFLALMRRAILADALGVGKTAQAIAAALLAMQPAALRGTPLAGGSSAPWRTLILAPKTLLPQWKKELARWAGADACILKPETPQPVSGFALIGYDTARHRGTPERPPSPAGAPKPGPDAAWAERKAAARAAFGGRAEPAGLWLPGRELGCETLILDEATALKNPYAARTKLVHGLAREARHVFILTATPVRNTAADLWSLLHCVDPWRYGSYRRFVEHWFPTFTFPSDSGGLVEKVGRLPRKAEREAFRSLVSFHVLRRGKDAAPHPELVRTRVQLSMDSEQAGSYAAAEAGVLLYVRGRRELRGGSLDREDIPGILARLTRCRQVATDPALTDSPGDSPKTAWLLAWARENPREKALVYSPFAAYCRRVAALLSGAGHTAALLTGAESSRATTRAVESFQAGESRFLVASVGAGGVGLNLQAADAVIWTSLPWTADELDQGTARAWRRGRALPVREIVLVHPGTVDEAVEKAVAGKRGVADAVLPAWRAALDSVKERAAGLRRNQAG